MDDVFPEEPPGLPRCYRTPTAHPVPSSGPTLMCGCRSTWWRNSRGEQNTHPCDASPIPSSSCPTLVCAFCSGRRRMSQRPAMIDSMLLPSMEPEFSTIPAVAQTPHSVHLAQRTGRFSSIVCSTIHALLLFFDCRGKTEPCF